MELLLVLEYTIPGNPGLTHSLPTAFMNGLGTEWVMPGLPRMNAVCREWVLPGLPGMNAVCREWVLPGLPGMNAVCRE